MDERPTFGSLFAGIGGIDLGLERAGWRGRWQVEWDPYCQHVLAQHWPELPRYGDITAVDWSGVERVDLLAGGFPCQPVSKAGGRAAEADSRWLWPEFVRAIRILRPRYVLVENVTNLLGIGGGTVFGGILGDLASSGYDAEWDCIPASFVGALHERDRVWLVAYLDRDGPVRLEVPAGRVERPEPAQSPIDASDWWTRKSRVGRVADGLPSGLDERRITGLGNAVVPQVVEYIGRRLLEAEALT